MAQLVFDTLASATQQKFKDVVNVLYYNTEISNLQVELWRFEEKRFECQLHVAAVSRALQEVPTDVETWLNRADDILRKGELICNNRRRYNFLDIISRYNLARSAKRLLIEMNEFPAPDFERFTVLAKSNMTDSSSAIEVVAEVSFMAMVMEVLKIEGLTSLIGLHWIGDGKSSAVQLWGRASLKANIFDEVAMLDVAYSPSSMSDIQCALVAMLGWELISSGAGLMSMMAERRRVFNNRLLRSRVLVVLYNVKETLELRDIGILGKYPCSKVVVISSELSIFKEMGIQTTFQPSEVQAIYNWNHFKRKTGEWVQKAGLDCIANEFVNQYCEDHPEARLEEMGKLADEMNEWIKRTEISNGIYIPDASAVINTRRMNLFRRN